MNSSQQKQIKQSLRMEQDKINPLLIRKFLQISLMNNMDMDSGWDSWQNILNHNQMERTKHGTLFQDSQVKIHMITSEWEIVLWLFGKDKDFITLQHAILLPTMSIWFKIIITRMILKVYGLTSTIHTMLKWTKQSVSSNMELKISKKLFMRQLIHWPNI